MCCSDEGAGPSVDIEFFDELHKLFDRFPEVSQKYSIDTFPSEAERLGVNLETHIAVTRYESNRIIIEVQPRDVARRGACCQWKMPHECVRTCEPLI